MALFWWFQKQKHEKSVTVSGDVVSEFMAENSQNNSVQDMTKSSYSRRQMKTHVVGAKYLEIAKVTAAAKQ